MLPIQDTKSRDSNNTIDTVDTMSTFVWNGIFFQISLLTVYDSAGLNSFVRLDNHSIMGALTAQSTAVRTNIKAKPIIALIKSFLAFSCVPFSSDRAYASPSDTHLNIPNTLTTDNKSGITVQMICHTGSSARVRFGPELARNKFVIISSSSLFLVVKSKVFRYIYDVTVRNFKNHRSIFFVFFFVQNILNIFFCVFHYRCCRRPVKRHINNLKLR